MQVSDTANGKGLHGRLQVHRALVGDLAAENSGACEGAWVACEGSELRQKIDTDTRGGWQSGL